MASSRKLSRTKNNVAPSTKLSQSPPPLSTWNRVLLAALTAMFVAQPLIPSEAVAIEGHGVLLTLLWFLLLFVWAVGRFRLDPRPIQFESIDWAVLALVLWHTISALLAFNSGSPRPALNMLWEWAALATCFFLARQIIRSKQVARALVAVMIAIALGVALIGYWQFFYQQTADIAFYESIENDPQAMFNLTGHWYEPGSSGAINFKNRLKSREPIATFSLTNSLAGFLLPWFLMLMGIVLFGRPSPTFSSLQENKPNDKLPWRNFGILVAALTIAGCLILTKSRTAYLATLFGLVALWPLCRRHNGSTDSQPKLNSAQRTKQRTEAREKSPKPNPSAENLTKSPSRKRGQLTFLFGGAILVLLIVATYFGGLDKQILTEAGKSLGYRGQYWQSTLSIVSDSPLFGCGPGQFRDHYTEYKLPQASEEIQDPHNFLLELWATSGTPALLAMLSIIGLLLWKTFSKQLACSVSTDEAASHNSSVFSDAPLAPAKKAQKSNRKKKQSQTKKESTDHRLLFSIALGAGIGIFLAALIRLLLGFSTDPLLVLFGLAGLGSVLWLLWPWVLSGSLPPKLPVLAAVALLINLLVAGGIGYAGVAGSWWLLLAVAWFALSPDSSNTENASGNARERKDRFSPSGSMAPSKANNPNLRSACLSVSIAAVLFLLCHQTLYAPVMLSATEVYRASSMVNRPGRLNHLEQIQTLESALEKDRYSLRAAQNLASARFLAWLTSPTPTALEQFIEADHRMLSLGPRSHAVWLRSARWWADVCRQSPNGANGQLAQERFKTALSRYPTHAKTRAEYAILLANLNQPKQASVEANAALEQNKITQAAGHMEKTFSDELRKQLESLAN